MELTHLDSKGQLRMVNITEKKVVKRWARARAKIKLNPTTLERLKGEELPKGEALGCARVAAIQGAKKTAELIPLCHNLPIEHLGIDFKFYHQELEIIASAVTTAKTGIEMEVLTAVSIGALAIYDMCKAVDKEIKITDIQLLEKGKE